jgi:general secretion pathway protein J
MRQRGFTLVEMMVALAIFAVISTAGVSVVTYALAESGPLAAASARLNELQLARAVMRGDFGQVAARPVRSSYGTHTGEGFKGGFGIGDGAVFAFVRRGWDNPGSAEPRSSLQYVAYYFEDGNLRRVTRPLLDATNETPEESATILSGVNNLRISFFRDGQWSEQWIAIGGGTFLPSVIAIDAEIEGIGPVRQLFLTPGAA